MSTDTQPTLLPRSQFKHPIAEFDHVLVPTLSAMMRFDTVRHAAHVRGPDIFPSGIARMMAYWIVMGKAPEVKDLGISDLERLERLRNAVSSDEYPPNAEIGIKLLDEQTRRNGIPLVIGQLYWAIQRLDDCSALPFVRRRLMHAFDIAEGVALFDPFGGWEVRNGH